MPGTSAMNHFFDLSIFPIQWRITIWIDNWYFIISHHESFNLSFPRSFSHGHVDFAIGCIKTWTTNLRLPPKWWYIALTIWASQWRNSWFINPWLTWLCTWINIHSSAILAWTEACRLILITYPFKTRLDDSCWWPHDRGAWSVRTRPRWISAHQPASCTHSILQERVDAEILRICGGVSLIHTQLNCLHQSIGFTESNSSPMGPAHAGHGVAGHAPWLTGNRSLSSLGSWACHVNHIALGPSLVNLLHVSHAKTCLKETSVSKQYYLHQLYQYSINADQ